MRFLLALPMPLAQHCLGKYSGLVEHRHANKPPNLALNYRE